MPIPISIDLTEVIQEFSLVEGQVKQLGSLLVSEITNRIYENWAGAAKQELKSTRNLYLRNLNVQRNGEYSASIVLTGQFPNMLENGFSAFDMKTAFAKSQKAKKDGKGWYLTVPFRFATPVSLGESEVFSNVLPVEVYNAVKILQAAKTQIGLGRIQAAQPLSSVPTPYDQAKKRGAFSDVITKQTFPEYQHKNSIYAGMIRQEKTYEKATQSSYVTFRRVSDKSDPYSWIHRGIAAKQFAEKAIQRTDVGGITDRTIDQFLLQLNAS